MSRTAGFEEAEAPSFELMQIADDGLPLGKLAEAAEVLGVAEPVLGARLMGKATYYRLKKRKDARLGPAQSATILRQLRLRAFANRVFKDERRAQLFMAKPHAMLGGIAPFEAAFSEFGGEAVSDLLGQAQYGSAA